MPDAVYHLRRVWNPEKEFQHVIVDDVGTHRGHAGYHQRFADDRDMASHEARNDHAQDHR
jgi:hypothetical protein